MVDINEIYKSSSSFLKAEDIGDEMLTVTIKDVELKEFDNGDRKVVLTFVEIDKALVLNATNARAISAMYGHNGERWKGRRIMLFSMPVDFQGKTVQGLRVRPPQSGASQSSPPRDDTPPPTGPGDYGSDPDDGDIDF